MLIALVRAWEEIACSCLVGMNTPKKFRDLSKSNGGVEVSVPVSVYMFKPHFLNKFIKALPFSFEGWLLLF
jgi:hypothetical protein